MSSDQQTDIGNPVGKTGFLKPWLRLWIVVFAVMLGAVVLLDLSAGESVRGVDYGTRLFQAALVASALTGLLWILWTLCYHEEPGGRPISLFVLGAALGFILFTSLFYTVENYRGKRAWLKCANTSRARGEKLTLANHAPPAVPDGENFAMQPIWVETITRTMGAEKARSWYGDRVDAFVQTNETRPIPLKTELYEVSAMTNYTGNWRLAGVTDLTLWRDYYRQLAQRTNYFPVSSGSQTAAEDVLLALSRDNEVIEEMRTASALSYARFPLDYTNPNPAIILLPHLAALKQCVSHLQLRACAEVQAGKADAALADIRLMLRLNDLIRDEPTLISQLVHIAVFQIEVQAMWEGLAQRQWNENQLAQLDTWLAQSDFLKSYEQSMAGEKAFGCQMISYTEQNRHELQNVMGDLFRLPGNLGDNETLMNGLARVIPSGWFDQNKAVLWRFYDEHLNQLVDLEHRTYSASNAIKVANAESKIGSGSSPYDRVASMLVSALSKAAKKFVFAQHTLDFARIAIALERYRLTNGQFPERLDALSPEFLILIPRDVISGEHLRYRRTEVGSFVLYSVGWNETDDAGNVGQTPSGRPNPEAGDWVWRYPEGK